MKETFDSSFWEKFEKSVKANFSRHTANCRIIYAKRYSRILVDGYASDLMGLSNDKRIHIMKALSTLSKYAGCYDRWKSIVALHGLKWSSENSNNIFEKITDGARTLNSMVEWFKKARARLPPTYGNLLLFAALVGLRPSEACQSTMILHQRGTVGYLNESNMTLEHFRFPLIFIRRTKNAFISVVTNVEIADISKALYSLIFWSGEKRMKKLLIVMDASNDVITITLTFLCS